MPPAELKLAWLTALLLGYSSRVIADHPTDLQLTAKELLRHWQTEQVTDKNEGFDARERHL
jgi:hypothetical protein